MSIFNGLLDTVKKGAVGVALGCSLKEATRQAPNKMGCYLIYYKGKCVYVGKAEDGIRKRFVQYYNGTTSHYTSGRMIYEHRDELSVKWIILPTREACRTVEGKLIEKYGKENLWNSQSGWGR